MSWEFMKMFVYVGTFLSVTIMNYAMQSVHHPQPPSNKYIQLHRTSDDFLSDFQKIYGARNFLDISETEAPRYIKLDGLGLTAEESSLLRRELAIVAESLSSPENIDLDEWNRLYIRDYIHQGSSLGSYGYRVNELSLADTEKLINFFKVFYCRDRDKLYKFYRPLLMHASILGSAEAQYELGKDLYNELCEKSMQRQFGMPEASITKGNDDSMLSLKAFIWLEAAARVGHEGAQVQLIESARKSSVLPFDKTMAWVLKICKQLPCKHDVLKERNLVNALLAAVCPNKREYQRRSRYLSDLRVQNRQLYQQRIKELDEEVTHKVTLYNQRLMVYKPTLASSCALKRATSEPDLPSSHKRYYVKIPIEGFGALPSLCKSIINEISPGCSD